jgi:hypothetical protein
LLDFIAPFLLVICICMSTLLVINFLLRKLIVRSIKENVFNGEIIIRVSQLLLYVYSVCQVIERLCQGGYQVQRTLLNIRLKISQKLS